jgi:hypothetical protein
LDLVAQGLFVGILGFLNSRQEFAELIEGDGKAFPLHTPEPVVHWFSRCTGIGSLIIRILSVACCAC